VVAYAPAVEALEIFSNVELLKSRLNREYTVLASD
jgi:hypothetical protein